MKSFFLPVLLLAGALTLCGCSPKQSNITGQGPASNDRASSTWNAFESYSKALQTQTGPYRLQTSVRYTDPQGDGHRVNTVIWSNGDLPIRADVMAGIGSLVGRVSQSEEELVIHAPREDKAWVYKGDGQAFLAFGMPIPLAMSDLVSIMRGRFLEAFGPVRGVDPFEAGQGNLGYRLEGGELPGTVVLNPDGLLLRWQEAPGSWDLNVAYDDSTPPLPKEITIEHPDGNRAVITINARQDASHFTDAQLQLRLPPGTTVQNLQQAAR